MKSLLVLFCILPIMLYSQISFNPPYVLSQVANTKVENLSVYYEGSNYFAAWREKGIYGSSNRLLFKRSTDYGVTWSNTTCFSTMSQSQRPAIIAMGADTVIILYQNGYNNITPDIAVQRSTDGGSTWLEEPMILDSNKYFSPHIAKEGLTIYALYTEIFSNYAYRLKYAKSTDFGDTWSNHIQLAPNVTGNVFRIKAMNDNVYCIWKDFQQFYFLKSTNRGQGFNYPPYQITYGSSDLVSLFLSEDETLYLAYEEMPPSAFYPKEIFLKKLTDGIWSDHINITNTPTGHSLNPAISVKNENIYLVWQEQDTLCLKRSSNGGITWQDSIKFPGMADYMSIPAICLGVKDTSLVLTVLWSNLVGESSFLVAANGTHDGILTGVSDVNNKAFFLNQNYPNPFNSTTGIKYSIPEESHVSLRIFDVLGREVEILLNEEKPAGIYEQTWNAANLPSGIYFYKMQTGNFIETKKMILMR